MTEEEYIIRKKNWVRNLKPGDIVQNCKFQVLEVIEVHGDPNNIYDIFVKLVDGSECSAWHCCDSLELIAEWEKNGIPSPAPIE